MEESSVYNIGAADPGLLAKGQDSVYHACACGDAEAALSPSSLLSLSDLVEEISKQLTCCRDMPLPKRQHIRRLLERLEVNQDEFARFAHFDADKRYTRNLIATEEQTEATLGFTLLLLCWNPGKESPVHDHPCDGCWFRVIQGSVCETRYLLPDKDSVCRALVRTGECTAASGDVAYMDDSMGLHKVGNPSPSVPAMTLHLYSPPFSKCSVWMDESNSERRCQPTVTYYSENGEVLDYECGASGKVGASPSDLCSKSPQAAAGATAGAVSQCKSAGAGR